MTTDDGEGDDEWQYPAINCTNNNRRLNGRIGGEQKIDNNKLNSTFRSRMFAVRSGSVHGWCGRVRDHYCDRDYEMISN